MEDIKGVKLYYDNSKDLYEGLIIENDNGVQNQVGHIFPAFRDKYGKLLAAAPALYEALKQAEAWFEKHSSSPTGLFAQQIIHKALAEANGKED